MKKLILILILTASVTINSFAQSVEKRVLDAVSEQKTANSKDILTTFFKAGIENLTGDDRKFSFNSSFFGIDSIFRKKGKSPTYEQERKWRNNSLNFGFTSDSTNSISKFDAGFTISIINQTNIKLKDFDPKDTQTLKEMGILIDAIAVEFLTYFGNKHPAEYNNLATNKLVSKSWTDANKTSDYKKLHPFILEALKDPAFINAVMTDASIANKPDKIELERAVDLILKGTDPFIQTYTNIAERYARKPIWTITPTGAYDRTTKQGEYGLASDFTVGLTKNPERKPWETEAKLRYRMGNDTTIKSANYKNKPFSISLGVNKVLIQNEEKESKMEFKFFTQYDYQFGSAKQATDTELFTLNSTLRINIYKSLWLPLTIKYDPKNANVFGYFSFTANLGN